MSMNINLRVGQTLKFNDGLISVTVLEKTGQRIKLKVEADDSVSIQPPEKETTPAAGGINMNVQKMMTGAV